VVIFRSKEDHRTDVVKRCVGLPGDRIEVRADQLMINGEVVDDSAVTKFEEPPGFFQLSRRERLETAHARANFGPITVPEESFFCMGDNRWNSHDSRIWGTLPAHLVKGRASVIYWSYGGTTPDGEYHGVGHRLKQLGSTALGFFSKTRWERTLRLIR
jgi:signal peptidase I